MQEMDIAICKICHSPASNVPNAFCIPDAPWLSFLVQRPLLRFGRHKYIAQWRPRIPCKMCYY